MLAWKSLGVSFVALALTTFLSAARADDDKDKGTTLIEKDSGKKVTLGKDEILTVKLEMTAGTGFTWVIAKNDKYDPKVLPQEGKVEIIPAKKDVVGGKANMIFRFKAAEAGTSELELQYKRPFEKDKEPAKIFKTTVQVK